MKATLWVWILTLGSIIPMKAAHPEAAKDAESQEMAPLYLELGEQRNLPLPELLRFSVSGAAIRYTRLKNQDRLFIKAIQPGISQLEVLQGPDPSQARASTRLIRVVKTQSTGRTADFLQALSKLGDLEVIDAGKRFVIRGPIKNRHQAQVLAELRDHFPDHIGDETEIDPIWLSQILPRVKKAIESHPQIRLETQTSGLLIRGAVSHPERLLDLQRQIRSILPLARFDVQTIQTQNATLYFKIYLLEMKRETLRTLGVKWPKDHPMSLQVASYDSPEWFLGGPTQIDLSVQALSQKGQLRILSSPELVVRCPGQAELFAGGELPIRQRSKFNDNVTWKNVGLSLKLDAKEYSGEKVRLNIETELSHVDQSYDNDEIPGVKSNRIKTQVDAQMGRPLFLSGLLQEDWQKNVSGIPGLANIPILGSLFSSEDFKNQRSELVAVLVPSRDPPAEPVTRLGPGLPKGFLPLARYPRSAADLDAIRESPQYPWNAFE